jgi:UDP-glucose 4-epimerase
VEEYLHTFEVLYGLRWTSLALGNVFGPRQDPTGEAGVVSMFGGRMLAGEPVTIYGDGEQTRDFVFVDDVVHAYVLAMRAGDGHRFNIGTSEATSVNELFDSLARITGHAQEPVTAPERPGELRHIALDARLAARELGWKPWTTLEDGLAATVDWLRGP